jgi:hypothetical protein
MLVYLGRDSKCVTAKMTAVYTTVSGLNYKDWKFGTQTLHGQFFFLMTFGDLHPKAINCCGTVRPN